MKETRRDGPGKLHPRAGLSGAMSVQTWEHCNTPGRQPQPAHRGGGTRWSNGRGGQEEEQMGQERASSSLGPAEMSGG